MKAREFWGGLVTGKSWETLVSLAREYDFIVIGGWAAYLWTGIHKSKDIDIVIDYGTLNLFRKGFALEKNERLKKYEVKMEEFDIGIYLPGFSKLSFPLEKLEGHAANVQGMKVPIPEVLVLLKQGAEIERRGSIKGKKDLIDILTLVAHSGFSVKKYKGIASGFSLGKFEGVLADEMALFNPKDCEYLGMNVEEFSGFKRRIIRELKG